MREFLESLFSSDFMPHGYCYLWKPGLVWLHLISDALIALFHPRNTDLFHPGETRPALQLDVRQFWDIYPGLWWHTCHGNVDALAWREQLALSIVRRLRTFRNGQCH
jgi:hypothetical protein